MIKLAPSILSADFANLESEMKKVTDLGAEYIHVDVMDGMFVPNITIGSPVVKSLRKVTGAVLDVHLMVEHPENQIQAFADAGADIITFHIETTKHAHRLIQSIKESGCKAGIALNPGTPLYLLEEVADNLDMILLMTVNPGFAGQKFILPMVEKIAMLHNQLQTLGVEIDIEVDGGINEETAALVREAGANILVAGSAIYNATDMQKAMNAIRG